MDMECLEHAIVQYGTPLYIFDIDEVQKTVQEYRNILGNKAGLCFAMKANSFLVNQMETVVDRIEVCSMGEFQICKKCHVPPEKILISGVLKKREDIYEILEYYHGKCTYTVESLNQFQDFADWCEVNQEVIPVYLRLTSGNQFGIDKDVIKDMIEVRRMSSFLKIQGIHYFSGTQKKSIENVRKELEYLDQFCKELEEETGFQIEELEYGPGISVPYFEGQKNTVENDLKELMESIVKMKWKGSVMLEMGRVLAASCGYYLTSVRDVKQNGGKNYCIVDGGIHQMNYDGQIRGMFKPCLRVSPEHDTEKAEIWTVCGSLCTTNDVLIQSVEIKGLRVDNVLIFEYVGAYSVTEGMALFLSHELPKVAFYSKEMGWKLVRNERQTYEDNMEKEIEDGQFDEYFNRVR
ncbi:diaminopimelate decarboxylase family protein [Extibacter muris]|uniref:Decarboxylase n=1 Tax=Extibacter muris TaxID=1796622 RepID=A0A4R4F987_9FIRM|nr:alanine racemase [Extibacter muris]MCU0081160.1 alanine racemase [Extibacter muris]TDA20157.1 decarboxylase [Extibacter muris]